MLEVMVEEVIWFEVKLVLFDQLRVWLGKEVVVEIVCVVLGMFFMILVYVMVVFFVILNCIFVLCYDYFWSVFIILILIYVLVYKFDGNDF